MLLLEVKHKEGAIKPAKAGVYVVIQKPLHQDLLAFTR